MNHPFPIHWNFLMFGNYLGSHPAPQILRKYLDHLGSIEIDHPLMDHMSIHIVINIVDHYIYHLSKMINILSEITILNHISRLIRFEDIFSVVHVTVSPWWEVAAVVGR